MLAVKDLLGHPSGMTQEEGALEQSVFRFPGVISDSDRQTVLAAADGQEPFAAGVFVAGGDGTAQDVSRRDAAVVALDLPWLQERVWPLVNLANRAGGWRLPLRAVTPWQLATYGPGGHHDWHEDTEPSAFAARQDGLERKITVSMRLSAEGAYDGGTFEVLTPEAGCAITQLDALGDTIVFPAHLRHRVAPVTHGQRESLVMWVLGPQET